MQQAWLSVIGLGMDIVGFAFIALDWRRAFQDRIDQRYVELEELEAEIGRQYSGDDVALNEDEEEIPFHAPKHMAEGIEWQRRTEPRLFYGGCLLVFLGFLLQILGTFPGGIPALGIVSQFPS